MSKVYNKINTVENVVASSTMTARLPIGRTYHALHLALTNITAALIDEVRVIANSETIIRASGAELDALNQELGLAAIATSGILHIPFDRPKLNQRAMSEQTALVTGLPSVDGVTIQTLTLEMDIGAATAPAVTLTAEQSQARSGHAGWIKRLMPMVVSLAAGETQLDNLQVGGRKFQGINRLLIDEAAAVLTELRIERDQHIVWDRTAALNNSLLADYDRAAIAGYFIADFTENGYGGNSLEVGGAADFRLVCQSASAQTGTRVLAEYLGKL